MPQEKNQTTLVTGAAGFIGFHLCNKLLENGNRVIGLDNLNPYYDVSLKMARLEHLKSHEAFLFYKVDIEDLPQLKEYRTPACAARLQIRSMGCFRNISFSWGRSSISAL